MYYFSFLFGIGKNNSIEIESAKISGLSIFYEPKKAIQFEKFVETQDSISKEWRKWCVFLVDNNRVKINAAKIANVLKIHIDQIKKLDSATLVSKIKNSCVNEKIKLMKSLKDPKQIDIKIKSFAETLFDNESSDMHHVCELQFGNEMQTVKFVAFRQACKFRILFFTPNEINLGGNSTIVKVTDISKGIWGVLKIGYKEAKLKTECEASLKQEAKAFNICYGKDTCEGQESIGWEIRPTPLFQLPLTVLNRESSTMVECLLKPYYKEHDLLEFLEKRDLDLNLKIQACFQLIEGLQKFADRDIWLLDISLENIAVNENEFRLSDYGNLNSKSCLQEEQVTSIVYKRKTKYIKYDEDCLILELRDKILKEKSAETINEFCEAAKKIDVFALGVCLYILVNKSFQWPYYLEENKSLDSGTLEEYPSTLRLTFLKEIEFLRPLFEKIFIEPAKRITASQLAKEFLSLVEKNLLEFQIYRKIKVLREIKL